MKKTYTWIGIDIPILKFDLKMKLTLFFFTIVLLQVHANNSYSQKARVDIDVRNESLKTVFDIIESQTEFKFFYKNEEIDLKKSITAKFKKEKINIILDSIFQNSKITYLVKNKQIILKSSEKPTPINTQLSQIISGTVTDSNGNPIMGVTVMIKNSKTGVVTDEFGQYSIAANTGDILIFSFMGFNPESITIKETTQVDVSLSTSTNDLDEVVLIGYGKTSKKLATGNVSTISGDQIQRQPVTNVLEALQGSTPGLFISQSNGLTGSRSNVSIRGQVSISSGQAPLYIIDGVPFNSTPVNILVGGYNSYGSGAGLIDPLNSINPTDIESITVLKDADATSIYGSRGANGVILITTKKSKGEGDRVDIYSYTGFGKITNTISTLNLADYLKVRREAFTNDGITPNSQNAPDLVDWDQAKATDFQKEFLENTAQRSEASVTFSGGDKLFNYIFSNTLRDETTVFPGDLGYNRFASHLGVSKTSANGKFNIALSAFYTKEKNDQSPVDYTSRIYNLPPNYPLYNDDGSLNWIPNSNFVNPLSYGMQKSQFKSTNLLANAALSYDILPDLAFTVNLGYNKIDQGSVVQLPLSSVRPGTEDSSSSLFSSSYVETYNVEPQIDFVRNFKHSKLSILFGGSYQASDFVQAFNMTARGYTVDDLLGNLGAASEISSFGNGFGEYNFASLFGRINYTLDDKYLLTLTGRRDGSTRFGKNKRWGNFGSVGAGWIFSNEKWFENALPWFSHGKLRGSYGTVGNDQIPDYGYLDSYGSFYYNYEGSPIIPQRIANPNYSWESTRKMEFSLETGFFKDRILFTTTWFRNRTDNQLISAPLPAQTGFTSYQANLPALVESRGWEFELSTVNIRSKEFSWNSSFNLTIPRNKLISFPGLENTVFRGVFIEGESIRNYTGYNYIGVIDGVPTVEDVNGDGVISAGLTQTLDGDYRILGRSTPDYYGGLSNNLKWNGFNLNFVLQYVKQIKPGIRQYNAAPGMLNNYDSNIVKDGFYYSQNSASEAVMAYNNFYLRSNAFYSDASFIRLKNVSLSYQLPQSVLETTFFKQVGVSVKGQNLLTFTEYDGYDPETGPIALPPLRMLTFGINCSF